MNKDNYIIKIENGVVRDAAVRFSCPLNLTIRKGENVAVVGDNGSGKTILMDTLTGRYPLRDGTLLYDFSPSPTDAVYKNVSCISFRDIYGSSVADYCYQLRWNVHEQDDVPCVRDVIGEKLGALNDEGCLRLFGMEQMLDKKVVALSSGELRKLQIAIALADNPRLLVLDNPFIGLDAASRGTLQELLARLTLDNRLQFIFVVPDADEIPACTHRVVSVDNKNVSGEYSCKGYFAMLQKENPLLDERLCAAISQKQNAVSELSDNAAVASSGQVLQMNNVTVGYGPRTILKDFSWVVNSGEVWALEGPNGSGKSTLLGLVCADNLQSYACDMSLFGRKRGTGESIWEIKKQIGYVSPEMHRSYLRNIPVADIVASGLFDSIGLYRKASEQQYAACRFWLEIFGLSDIADKSFLRVSSGQQRLALLARAFVKDPSLLILDEPFHGLDAKNKKTAKAIVEAFSRREGKTVLFVSHNKDEFPCTVTNRIVLGKNK